VNKGGTVEQEIKPIPSLCLARFRHMEMDRLFYFEKILTIGGSINGSCLEGNKG
jgi:hypothetical protein